MRKAASLKTSTNSNQENKGISVVVRKNQARFKRIRVPEGPDRGVGTFFLLVEVSQGDSDIYIPLSVASGKKPAGFVYQIEGTAKGEIESGEVSLGIGAGTHVTLGTILYAKIPKGKTATFRLFISMRGRAGGEYGILITRIHYKFHPSDVRYQKYEKPLASKTVKFS